ncbi:MAG: type II toxin-antitoxin system Phd/YefM family antitoxin [Micrococcales bacterium]
MGQTVNIHYAKTHLSELAAEVEAGGEVIICRRGEPIMKLVRIEKTLPPITPGFAKDLLNEMFPNWTEEDWERSDREIAEKWASGEWNKPLEDA